MGSGTLVDARIVLAAGGLAETDLLAEYMRSGTAAANLSEGTLEGFFLIGGVPIPAIRALAGTTAIRLVPIPDDVLTNMHEKYGPYDRAVIPADVYPGVGVATPTVGFHALWVAAVSTSDDLIYAITRALWNEATQRLLDAHDPIGKQVRLENALDGLRYRCIRGQTVHRGGISVMMVARSPIAPAVKQSDQSSLQEREGCFGSTVPGMG